MKAIWIDAGWYPVRIVFCPDEASWNRLMKRLGPVGTPYPAKPMGAACSAFEDCGGDRVIVVTCGTGFEDPVEIVCALVHEAVHVWQRILEHINEKDPGWEPEAYAIQHISKGLIRAYSVTRMP